MAFAIAALGAQGRPPSPAPTSVAVSYPGFFDTLERLLTGEGRQDLPRGLHGGRQDDGGARALGAGSAGAPRTSTSSSRRASGRTVADIFAPRGRAVLPRRRARRPRRRCSPCATSSWPPAAARSSIRTTARRSTATACRSGSTCRSPSSSPGCRPTAGGRSPRTARRSSASTRRGARVRAGAPAARRRRRAASSDLVERGRRRAWTRETMRYLILSDIHAQPRGARRGARRGDRASYDRARSCSAISSGTAPIRTPSSIACASSPRSRRSAATTTRSRAASRTPRASTTSRGSAAELDACARSRAENRAYLAALPAGPVVVDDSSKSATGRRSTRTHYIFDELDALRRARVPRRARCASSGTRTSRSASTAQGSKASSSDARPGDAICGGAAARRLYRQPRIGGSAARRRSAGGLAHPRRRGRVDYLSPRRVPGRACRRRRIRGGGLPDRRWRAGWRCGR